MVLVGVSGPVGSGKTKLLSGLVEWAVGKGSSVDGFLAFARGRVDGNRGAREYVLRMVKSQKDIPFARRDDTLNPPYQINPESLKQLDSWARELAGNPSPAVLLLDEFGPLEARGGGHMALWPYILNARAEIVVIAVRDKLVRDIERQLGLPFDVVIDATSSSAQNEVQTLLLHHSDWIRVGQFGAAAGGFEATVGSMLHQTKIPMAGLFLSTVQSLVMMYAGDRLSQRIRVMWVPVISAGLKALSPYGSRLRPMLAITVQGFLFSISVTLLGWNPLGILLGGWSVGAWTAVQGILLQYVIIGDNLFPALDMAIRWLALQLNLTLPGIVSMVAIWIAISGTISSVTTLIAWSRRHRLPARISALLEKGSSSIIGQTPAPTVKVAFQRGLHDLARPMFWAPVAVVALIVGASGSSWEDTLWMIIRAVAVGWALFSVARLFNPHKFATWLRRRGHWGPAMALSRALHVKQGPPAQMQDGDGQAGEPEHKGRDGR